MSTKSTLPSKDKGFGDTLARIFTVTGVKAVVDKISEVTGKDCGCSERQEALNELLPYKTQ
jgi:hypothetical protein